MKDNTNPLKQYFRDIILYAQLPSGGKYYDDSILSLTDSNEVPIMAMTSKDELSLKNPDGLLNGEALCSVLLSCIPGLKQPKKLLINDVDALIVYIRKATNGDELSMKSTCPKCEHENGFSLNLNSILDMAGHLDESYPVNLHNGLTVFLQPFTYDLSIKAQLASFEQTKIARSLEDQHLDESVKLSMFSKSFNTLSELNFSMIADSIIRVVNEEREINVTNKKHITEFLNNIDKNAADEIDKVLRVINKIGIKHAYSATCEKEECKHVWDAAIDFNPVNFFSGS